MATSVLERSPAVTQSTPVTHHRTTEVDGVNIFYREAGPAQAPVVLLLHGFPTSSHMFRNLIPALADRYHVIAPDYPGYGQSCRIAPSLPTPSTASASSSTACSISSGRSVTRCTSWITARRWAGGWR